MKVQLGGVAIMTCEYDGLNRRIVKTDDGVTKHSYYNEDWQELEVRREFSGTEDADPIEQLVWHPYYIDALATRFWDANASNSQTQYYTTHDANFNVTAAVNASGGVDERYDYSPYGVINIMSGTFVNDSDQTSEIGNTTTYTGRKLDRLVGIYYYRNRYYDPAMGRFITRDPIGYESRDENLYGYVNSSPLLKVDPAGLRSVCCSFSSDSQIWSETLECPDCESAQSCCDKRASWQWYAWYSWHVIGVSDRACINGSSQPSDCNQEGPSPACLPPILPVPDGNITKKMCRAACESLGLKSALLSDCLQMCKDFQGNRCNDLWARCAHLERHPSGGGKKQAEMCLLVYNLLCAGK